MSSPLRHLATQVRHRVKQWIGRPPRLYPLVFRYRDGYENRLVNHDTDLCIEGFPRSANSFAVGAFERVQDRELKMAHHNRVPAPILNAARRGLPTVVLIRDPLQTVIPNRGVQLQIGAVEGKEMPQRLSYETQLQTWMAFDETVEPVLDRVVVAPFEVVTNDFGAVIEALSYKFGTDFARFEHATENVESIRDSYGYLALPTSQRNLLKEQARDGFQRKIGTDRPLIGEARALHRSYWSQSLLV